MSHSDEPLSSYCGLLATILCATIYNCSIYIFINIHKNDALTVALYLSLVQCGIFAPSITRIASDMYGTSMYSPL